MGQEDFEMPAMVKRVKREVQPELLPVKDFAAKLGVSIWTARSYRHRSTLL
jgi:hypothetical protein